MRFIRDVLFTCLSILALLLVVEVGLRVGGARYTASFYTPEQERGYALRAGAEGWYTDENQLYDRINSDGMHDREHSMERPEHTLRIAVIGSSEVAAMEVPLEERFTAEAERELTPVLAAKGWRPEILDFGVPGYGPAQEYLTLHDHVWKYQPQIVMFVLSTWAVLKNTRELDPGSPAGGPYFVFKNGQLVPDAKTLARPPLSARQLYWKKKTADCINGSALLSLVRAAVIKLPRRLAAVGSTLHTHPKNLTLDPSKSWPYLTELPQMQLPWAITEGFVDLMKQECDQHHAELWFVVTDMNMQTYVDVAKREEFRQRLGIDSLFKPEARVQKFAESRNIPTVLLAPILFEYATSRQAPLHGFFNTAVDEGHWNELGHRIVGQVLSDSLLKSSQMLHSAAVLSDVPGTEHPAKGRLNPPREETARRSFDGH
jgi:hypothetical protein